MIVLDWPKDSKRALSSNGGVGGKWTVSKARKAARETGAYLARYARTRYNYWPEIPEKGDVRLRITFRPPSRSWDRLNMPGLFKSQIDGIADAWGVNDRRFLPVYVFAEPRKPGCCEIEVIEGAE